MSLNDAHTFQVGIVDWSGLEHLSRKLSESGIEPGTIQDSEWQIIEQALKHLVDHQDWEGIVRLRNLFNPLYAGDTVTGLAALQRLDYHALEAARCLGDKHELGHLLGAKGHNLHRQGYHQNAISAFDESAKNYWEIGEDFPALESYYMTALCHRALGDRNKSKGILENVLNKIRPDDPWRANPLQVMAWLIQDEGKLADSEKLLRQALILYKNTENSDTLIVGALADLGEIVGILGRVQESSELFEESLTVLSKYVGQYDRQEARVLLKYSELLVHQKDYNIAMKLLNRADDKVSRYGHYYDLLWQIELAKAILFLQQGHITNCFTKLRSVLRIRKHLGLSNVMLAQHVMARYAQRLLKTKRLISNS
jgi:tetratricopeptide (TPR) repeat protein